MIIHPVDIDLGKRRRITIYQDTDTHIGSDGHDALLHRRFIHRVEKDPLGYWIHTGDMLDEDRPSTRERKNMIFHDRPEVLDKEDKRHMDEIDRTIIPRYAPIASKCFGIIDGDHYLIFKNGTTSGMYISKKLGVKYLGERMAYVSVVFKENATQAIRYDILARHGKGSASTPGGDMNSLMKQNARWDADLLLGGHTHGENAHPEPVIGVNKGRTNFYQRIRWYVRGGSFLRGFVAGKQLYAEREEYGPLCIGWGQVDLVFGSNRMSGRNIAIVESRGSVCVG